MKGRKSVRNRPVKRLFGFAAWLLMLAAALPLVLSYLSIVVNPAQVWFVSLSGLLFVPLSVINLLLLLWAARRRSRTFVIPLMALMPSLFFFGRYVQPFQDDVDQDPSAEVIKVISYNVGRFALSGRQSGISGRSQCADSVFSFIRSQDADIICLQEFHIDDMDRIRQYLDSRMKGYRADYYMFTNSDGSFGNLTLSRLPVAGKGKLKFDGSTNLALYTDYVAYGMPFRVYNCHFESYNISFTGMVRALFNADPDAFAMAGTKMKRSITRRPKQVDQVFSNIEDCPSVSFVCGDFNDTPMSYTYYRMTRGRKDAFVEAGKGFGATYARLWPMLRIDYILYPDRCRAVEHQIPRIGFSDHYPVITKVQI